MWSDSCTDAELPAIFGYAGGLAWIFELDAEWLELHVNVTEGESEETSELGAALVGEGKRWDVAARRHGSGGSTSP